MWSQVGLHTVAQDRNGNGFCDIVFNLPGGSAARKLNWLQVEAASHIFIQIVCIFSSD